MYAPTRDEARRFFFDAWEKFGAGAPLTALERTAVEIIALHPEYHALLAAREHHLARDYGPEDGALNPFLHLSLHLGIAEQLAVDRPAGVREEIERLTRKHDDAHSALHDAIECLGDTMWQAQRMGTPPDPAAFLECLRKR